MNQILVDRFGRRHDNLRISVTDRCNLRCTYCMAEDVEFMPRDHLLTFEEIEHFVRVGATLGIRKLRLTGGEPLVRKDLPVLVGMLRRVPGIKDIGITTNGILLPGLAKPLFDAGLRRINISLDTLDRDQFKIITRRDAFDQVLAGIEAARAAGFDPIKINAVAMSGLTDNQVIPLATFCREKRLELRFIEFMPLEADGFWSRTKVFSADQILEALEAHGLGVDPLPPADLAAPAEEYVYRDGKGKIGIIASVTKPFCGACNRIRITAEGKLRNCLFSLEEIDVKPLLRGDGDNDAEIEARIRRCVEEKWEGHQINSVHFIRPARTMHAIGG